MNTMNGEMYVSGASLRAARWKLGLSQKEAAEKIGVQANNLSTMESNNRRMRPATLKRFVDFYGADAVMLVGPAAAAAAVSVLAEAAFEELIAELKRRFPGATLTVTL